MKVVKLLDKWSSIAFFFFKIYCYIGHQGLLKDVNYYIWRFKNLKPLLPNMVSLKGKKGHCCLKSFQWDLCEGQTSMYNS